MGTTESKLEEALFEIRRVIAGQEAMLERVLVCLIAGGHVLIEGVPGLAKTLTIKTHGGGVGGSFRRVQFTPDLVPADLVGTRIYRPDKAEFEIELGPVLCNFLLADEINRAPAKVQSALLEVMQERQVTIGGRTFPVPSPFLVLATQNPIESEGTYPLPEAQVDRFMLKVLVDYPSHDEELTVVSRSLEVAPELAQVLSLDELIGLQVRAAQVYVDPALISWTVDVATATRRPREYGVDGSRNSSRTARARADRSASSPPAGRWRSSAGATTSCLPTFEELVRDAFRHRLVLSYRALAEEVAPDAILDQVLAAVPCRSSTSAALLPRVRPRLSFGLIRCNWRSEQPLRRSPPAPGLGSNILAGRCVAAKPARPPENERTPDMTKARAASFTLAAALSACSRNVHGISRRTCLREHHRHRHDRQAVRVSFHALDEDREARNGRLQSHEQGQHPARLRHQRQEDEAAVEGRVGDADGHVREGRELSPTSARFRVTPRPG